MFNFSYKNPVEVVFGKDQIAALSDLLPKGKKILMTYGGGSIKKNGVYDQVKKATADFDVIEFSGIEPNPEYETCKKAIDLAKNEKVDFILAVGGGSVVDASKFIAAGALFDGDAWDILEKATPFNKALPLGCVLTLPATGTEMNNNAVVSRREKGLKLSFCNNAVFPVFSIMDPQATFSLPTKQTVNGVVDAFVHVMEQYMTYDVNAPLQDRQAEAILKTLIEEGKKVLKNPNDYDTRANIMWAATHGLNKMIACGVPQDWATHAIGHELTAKFGLDHGQTLAVVMPALWQVQKEGKKTKLANYARRVLDVVEGDDDKAADIAIVKTEAFFNELGMKTKLSDYGIKKEDCFFIAPIFEQRGRKLGENGDITPEKIKQIFTFAQ